MCSGGDFWQILPVIANGSRGDVVFSCITISYLWKICKICLLQQNMRLQQGQDEEEVAPLKKFANWYLQIGNGTVPHQSDDLHNYEKDDIVIPM